MRLLVITYSYTPDLTPRAFRWSAIAGQLVGRGHEVHVLCASASCPSETLDGVTVHRVADLLLNGSKRVSVGASSSTVPAGKRGGGWISGLLRQLVRRLWRALYWPDFACGWVLPAVHAVRKLEAKHCFDWIISSSHPFTDHLVALLAKRSAPSAHWLVDISDPFCLMKEPSPYNRLLYGWLSAHIEGRVLASADAISVTTDSTADLYEIHFPGSRKKTRVIGPLLSLPQLPASSRQSDGVLRLVFVGTLYRNLRSPRFLLDSFASLKAANPERRIELHFYGTVNDCAPDFSDLPEAIRGAVVVHGLVSRHDVLQAMVDADVLVNIGNHSETQLASKVAEYMAVGRPILNIVSVPKDTSVEALADYPSVLTLYRYLHLAHQSTTPALVAELGQFVFHASPVPAAVSQAARELHGPERVAGQYAEILESTWSPE